MARSACVSGVALVLAIAGLTGCGGDGDSSGQEGIRTAGGEPLETITITESEFKLSPATVKVDRTGVYTFHVVNDGTTTHALEVEGHGLETETEPLSPGSSADLRVELPEDGEYELYCPVGNHREQGMEGTLTAGSGGGAGSGGTTTSGGLGY
jgi:uncharacterized cupredoxin-like copper-binding protein